MGHNTNTSNTSNTATSSTQINNQNTHQVNNNVENLGTDKNITVNGDQIQGSVLNVNNFQANGDVCLGIGCAPPPQ